MFNINSWFAIRNLKPKTPLCKTYLSQQETQVTGLTCGVL